MGDSGGSGLNGNTANAAGSLGSELSLAGGAYSVGSSLASGTPTGYASAALSGTKLLAGNANTAGMFGSNASQVGAIAGAGGAALGLYGGLKQGGGVGDTQAALSAAQLAAPIATAAGATGLGTTLAAAGPIGLALAPALMGMSTPAVQLTGKYWGNVQDSLQKAIASGDKGQIASQVNGLLSQPQSQIPANIQQLVYQTGMVPSIGWGQQYTSTQFQDASNLLQQAGGNKNNQGGNKTGKS